MTRRSTRVDDYLRRHNPVPLDASAQASTTLASGRIRRPRVAITALTAAAVVVAVLVVTLGSDGPLSPRAAAAAIVRDLHGKDVLVWSTVERQRVARSSGYELNGTLETHFDGWYDLGDGASHSRVRTVRAGGGRGSVLFDLEQWSDGRSTSWQIDRRAADLRVGRQRIVVSKVTYPSRNPSLDTGPIAEAKRVLGAATAGKATLSDAGRSDGFPVTKVTSVSGLTTASFWIVRSDAPKILRSNVQTRDEHGNVIDSVGSTTTRWKFLPRTDRVARTAVTPPSFDPARYKLVTSVFLSPDAVRRP